MATPRAYHASISLKKENFTTIPGHDQHIAATASVAEKMHVVHSAIESVGNLAIELGSNRALTEVEKVLKVAKIADEKCAKAIDSVYSCITTLENNAKHIEKKFNEPLQQKAVAGKMNEEVRAHFKGIEKHEDRRKLMNESIETGDHVTACAVLGGLCFLSGFSKEEHQQYKNQYQQTTDPDSVEQLGVVRKCLERAERCLYLIKPEFNAAVGVDPQKVQMIRTEKARADAAIKAATT